MAYRIDDIPNLGGPQIVLPRRRRREGKRVRKETIANLTRVNRREKRISSEV